MQRAMVAFEQDERGDWVATLDCGHRQHVRHRPPWQERPWILTAETRRERIGSPLECRICDEEADEAQQTGGDPACWAHRVCPTCGALDSHRPEICQESVGDVETPGSAPSRR